MNTIESWKNVTQYGMHPILIKVRISLVYSNSPFQIYQVIDKWDPILRASSCQRDDLYQQAREQVHACINIGLTCTYMNDPNARPTIWQIVDMLRTMDGSTQVHDADATK